MSSPIAYYGSTRRLPSRRPLRAGPLTAFYEEGDLRYVRLGRHEVARRLHVAVRDSNWGTVPAVLANEQVDFDADSFRIEFDATHQRDEIHFRWHGTIVGSAAGKVDFCLDGVVLSTFLRNRIGFCVLHPPQTCAGAKCRLTLADGRTIDAEFPRDVAPQNPFLELRGLAHELPSGEWAVFCFEGELFETEDQRNWTDASFKTFCTPLRLPFPVKVSAGERVSQLVSLSLAGSGARTENSDAHATCLKLNDAPTTTLPEIGLGLADHGFPPTEEESQVLRALMPSHVRVEARHPWRELESAGEIARRLNCRLELAVTLSDSVEMEAQCLLAALEALRPPLARVLVFHDLNWVTPERIFTPVRKALAQHDAAIPIFVGTVANFAELNRDRPLFSGPTGLCYAIQPQEHSFDNDSLIECCAAIADTVSTARRIRGDCSICVSPITLRKRLNPYATGPATVPPPDELPPRVDPRQMSLFGAAWTLGALKYLAESGASSTTFYETTGWLGVVELETGCMLPERFPSRPRMAFPLFHVLADASEFRGASVIPAVSDDPLRIDGLAMRRGERTRVMLANMTCERQTCELLGVRGMPSVQILDESTFDHATNQPLAFRSYQNASSDASRGALTLRLQPYAYARIDY